MMHPKYYASRLPHHFTPTPLLSSLSITILLYHLGDWHPRIGKSGLYIFPMSHSKEGTTILNSLTQRLEDARSTQWAFLFPALNVYIIYVVTMENLSPTRTALPCVFEARCTSPRLTVNPRLRRYRALAWGYWWFSHYIFKFRKFSAQRIFSVESW